MLELISITIVFVIGYAGFIQWLWSMMQEGGAFDVVSSGWWSKKMDAFYGGNPRKKMLEKILGGCEQCASFWWSMPWAVAYFIFCKSTGIWCIGLSGSIIWALVFISICSLIGLKTLTHKKDGV